MTLRTAVIPFLLTLLLGGAVRAQEGAPAADAAASQKPMETIADVPSKGRLALVQAAEARQAGEYGRAVAILQDIVDNHPKLDHYLVRYHLANSLVLAGRTAESVAQYKAAVELEPRHSDSWLRLGQAAFETGDYFQAATALEKAFSTADTPQAAWLYYAGVAYLQNEDPVDAARVLRDLCTGRWGKPELDWFRALIAAESQNGNRRQGEKAVDDMLKIYPSEPDAWNLSYQHALQYEDYRAAAVALKVKDYLQPLDPEETVRLGDILSAAQAPSWAAQHYREALGAEPTSEDYERLVRAHLAAHEQDEALAVLSDALRTAPSFDLWNMKGYAAYEREDYATALDAFAECLKLDPEYGRAHTLMGYCALQMDRLAEAERYLTKALDTPAEQTTARGLLRDLKRRREALSE